MWNSNGGPQENYLQMLGFTHGLLFFDREQPFPTPLWLGGVYVDLFYGSYGLEHRNNLEEHEMKLEIMGIDNANNWNELDSLGIHWKKILHEHAQ